MGPESGHGETIDFGNVVRYDIYLDDEKIGETTTPTFVISSLPEGHHVVAVQAIYKNGQSELVTYEVEGTTGLASTQRLTSLGNSEVYDLSGRRMSSARGSKGLYIVRQNGVTRKLLK